MTPKNPTDEILDDLPVDQAEEETNSGIPTFVDDGPPEFAEDDAAAEETDEDEYEEVEEEVDEEEDLEPDDGEEDPEPEEAAEPPQVSPAAEIPPPAEITEPIDLPQGDAPAAGPPESPPGPDPVEASDMPPETLPVAPAAQQELQSGLEARAAPAPVVPAHPANTSAAPDALPPHPSTAVDVTAGGLPAVRLPAAPIELAASPCTLAPGEEIDAETAKQWDVMLAAVSQPTRLLVWESGIDSMQKLLSTPKSDLVSPRGRFKAGHVKELEDWLIKNLNRKLMESRQAAARSYVPPVPVKATGDGLATRQMTQGLAAQRQARFAAMSGDYNARRGRP